MDKEWKFQTYKVTTLAYDMLCEPTLLDNEDKEADNLSSNRLINLKILTTNTGNVLVYQQFAQEKALLMK